MRRRRGRPAIADADLCRGPGNVTKAMGITLAENRVDLTGARLFIEDRGIAAGPVAWSPRIGISVGTRAAVARVRRRPSRRFRQTIRVAD